MLVRLTALAISALLLVSASHAQAAMSRLDFSGVLTHVDDYAGISDGSVSVGTPFVGHAIFDLHRPPDYQTSYSADFVFVTPPAELSISYGSYVVTSGAAEGFPWSPDAFWMCLTDASTEDSVGLHSFFVLTSGSLGGDGFEPLLSNGGFSLRGAGISSHVDLSTVSFDLAAWTSTHLEIVLASGFEGDFAEFHVRGELTQLSLTAVPEPGTLALLGLGLGALSLRRRVRR
jgi:hypothetical protein